MKARTFFIRAAIMSLLSLALFSNSLARQEVNITVLDNLGHLTSATLLVYIFDAKSRTYTLWQGTTGNIDTTHTFGTDQFGVINGTFDISLQQTSNPTIHWIDEAHANIIVVRIGNTFIRLDYGGYPLAYGDIYIKVQGGIWTVAKSSNCGYSITAPQTWTDKTITLKNDFGSDRASCYGNIHFNSDTLTNVGNSGTTQTREAGTFPHTVAGESTQYVNNYYRIWRKFSELGYDSILVHLSTAAPYTRTATYAKQVTATVNKNYSGGYVTVNGIVANPTAYMYDDITNNVSSSPQGYTDGLYYELSYWTYNGSNNYSNPLQISNPTSNVTIGATFTRRPDNAGKNVRFSTTVGSPIVVYWTDNVNTNVTTYYVYRKVYKNGAWGPETLMSTLNRGVQQFQDPDYLLANYKQYDLINYDIREYFTTDMTYSYPQWVPVWGQLYSINNNDNMAMTVNAEKPIESAISNYPNPFNPTTIISFSVPHKSQIKLSVFDVLGREVSILANGVHEAGRYEITFDASNLPSGVYFYNLISGTSSITKKMLLIK